MSMNEFDMENWRQYLNDITTDALWISTETKQKNDGKFVIPKRDILPKNSNKFHGLFIPEIPYQFINRFTKKDGVVWDCFGGSGTTKRVSDILGRKCVINDLSPTEEYIQQGDSRTFNPGEIVDLIFMHPPYHTIIKYSDKEEDGSNLKTLDDFLEWFDSVVLNVNKYLKKKGHIILVCGNIYINSEEITLGVWCKDIVRKHGYILKSHIIKDYGQTKGSGNGYNLNFYRQLKHGYNNFYGDNIFILRKK